MTRLETRYNWGDELNNDNPRLYRQLNDMYTNVAEKSNGKSNKRKASSPPISTPNSSDLNKNYDIGDIWVDESTDTAWILTSRTTPDTVQWTQIT